MAIINRMKHRGGNGASRPDLARHRHHVVMRSCRHAVMRPHPGREEIRERAGPEGQDISRMRAHPRPGISIRRPGGISPKSTGPTAVTNGSRWFLPHCDRSPRTLRFLSGFPSCPDCGPGRQRFAAGSLDTPLSLSYPYLSAFFPVLALRFIGHRPPEALLRFSGCPAHSRPGDPSPVLFAQTQSGYRTGAGAPQGRRSGALFVACTWVAPGYGATQRKAQGSRHHDA
jgi:hypothetical protein